MATARKQAVLKPKNISRILVPVDFSQNASNAIRQAVFIAKSFMAKIDFIHVVTPVYAGASVDIMPTADVFYTKLIKDAEKRMKEIAMDIKNSEGVDIEIVSAMGVVHDCILAHAKKIKADLIIMGTHGTSGIKEFFAGSNAYRVVSDAKCPVLTIQKRIIKKGFKTIVLPITHQLNSRQKVNLVATLARIYFSKILITGYATGKNKSDMLKAKQYAAQVEKFLKNEAIDCKTFFIKDENFTKSILDFASTQKADLVAIMTNNDFSLKQMVNGTYAQQFVNHSKIPVLCSPDTLKFEYSYTPSLSGI